MMTTNEQFCIWWEQEVTECVKKYDKRIAGIVSTDPVYPMNSASTGIQVD